MFLTGYADWPDHACLRTTKLRSTRLKHRLALRWESEVQHGVFGGRRLDAHFRQFQTAHSLTVAPFRSPYFPCQAKKGVTYGEKLNETPATPAPASLVQYSIILPSPTFLASVYLFQFDLQQLQLNNFSSIFLQLVRTDSFPF